MGGLGFFVVTPIITVHAPGYLTFHLVHSVVEHILFRPFTFRMVDFLINQGHK